MVNVNSYVLSNAKWTKVLAKVLAKNQSTAPDYEMNTNYNGQGNVMFIEPGTVHLGTKKRVHIVSGAEASALKTEMGATVQVGNARPMSYGKYIVKSSWFRGVKGIEFGKWVRQCRKEAYIQAELSNRYARCNIFPHVMFHGFVRGAFHVVSECPPNLRLVDIDHISTVAEARATYNAVAAAIYLMWTSKVAPMRYAPHMFALAGPIRSPHAVVLDYNQIVIFDENVDNVIRPRLLRLKAAEGSCGRLSANPGTLELIWKQLGPMKARMIAKHRALYKEYKSAGETTKYTSVMKFLEMLGRAMNNPPGAGRRPVSGGGRGRRTLFGRGLRGILGGRRSRSDTSAEKAPPLKIRKVATLPESEGWRPRKHSATWGVTRTAESNHNNARHGNRTSQFPAIYTSPASTSVKGGNGGGGNGAASAPPAPPNNGVSKQAFGTAKAKSYFDPNDPNNKTNTEAYNAPYTLYNVRNKWSTWNQARKNYVVKDATEYFKLHIAILKNAPEMQAVLAQKIKNKNGSNDHNRLNANTQARSRSEAFDAMMKNIVTNALKTGKYKNHQSGAAHIDEMVRNEFLTVWKLVDPDTQVPLIEHYPIIVHYLKEFKTKSPGTYSELLDSNVLKYLTAEIYAYKHHTSNKNKNKNLEVHKKEILDNRITMYIATYLNTDGYIAAAINQDDFKEYINESLKRDLKAAETNVKTFVRKDNGRAKNYGLMNRKGLVESITGWLNPRFNASS